MKNGTLAVPLSASIVRVRRPSASITPSYTPGTWLAAISLGMGVTVLGAVVPARQAARSIYLCLHYNCGQRLVDAMRLNGTHSHKAKSYTNQQAC